MNALLPRKCPTCKGTGEVPLPLDIVGDVAVYAKNFTGMRICPTFGGCGGEKMIWTEDPHEATT